MTPTVLATAICLAHGVSQSPAVYRVALEELSPQSVRLVQAALDGAQRRGAVVLLDISSPSGEADAADRIASRVVESPVFVYALVSGPAWEGAAVVALAADSIFITERGSIGANPSQSSPASESLRATVGQMIAAGTLPAVAADMVGPADGTSARLTLSAVEAVAAGVAVGPVDGVDGFLDRVGLRRAEFIPVEAHWLGATVRVANRNSRDVRIFVRRGGRSRLGNVTSLHDAEFHIPEQMLVEGAFIELTAEVIGSTERVTTERIRVEPGLLIEWVIEEAIRQSNYFVSRRY